MTPIRWWRIWMMLRPRLHHRRRLPLRHRRHRPVNGPARTPNATRVARATASHLQRTQLRSFGSTLTRSPASVPVAAAEYDLLSPTAGSESRHKRQTLPDAALVPLEVWIRATAPTLSPKPNRWEGETHYADAVPPVVPFP
jgi:hypothetical protein